MLKYKFNLIFSLRPGLGREGLIHNVILTTKIEMGYKAFKPYRMHGRHGKYDRRKASVGDFVPTLVGSTSCNRILKVVQGWVQAFR